MNNKKDFHKTNDGVVININSKDYLRARNRNFVRREQVKIIGSDGKVAILEKKIAEMELLINKLVSNSDTNRRI